MTRANVSLGPTASALILIGIAVLTMVAVGGWGFALAWMRRGIR